MKKEYRLRKNAEFKQVYECRRNYWNRNLVLYIRKNGLENTRVGFTITKKIGNAVIRNKIRRRMKEIYKSNLNNIKAGYDLIFIPKKNTVDLSFHQLESAMVHILGISKMLKR